MDARDPLSNEPLTAAGSESEVMERDRFPQADRSSRLLGTANVIPWEADAVTWRMTYVGGQVTRMLGYPVQNWYQEQFWENHLHPEDRDWVVRFCQDNATQKRDYELEYRMIAADGQVVWLRDLVTVIPDAQGRPKLLQGFMFDITDRKRSEESLRQSEARFRAVFEQAGIGIGLGDMRGRLIYSNRALEEFLGYEERELRGMVFTEFTHPADADLDFQFYRELMDGRRDRYQMEKRYLRKDGQVVWGRLTVSLFPSREDLPRYAIGMVEDITERRRAEDALRDREHRLRQAFTEREQLNQDLHDSILQTLFAAGLSLYTCKQVMARDPLDAVRLIDHVCVQLKFVMAEVRSYIGDLGYDVLQGGDLESGLEAVVNSFRVATSSRIELILERGRIRALSAEKAINLIHITREALSNAVRHASASRIVVTLSGEARSLRLEVRDNGGGFQPVSELGQGKGLRNIRARAEKLGGTLTLRSEPGRGTCLVVQVPEA